MSLELNLRFPDSNCVVVRLEDDESGRIDFQSPLTAADQGDIRWYLEVYSAQYTTDVDDARAERIEQKLETWGDALFGAVFGDRATQRLLNRFQDSDEPGRLITISARHPDILGLPWELLRDPAGTYFVHDNPYISVRRRFAGAGGGRRAFKFVPKAQARVLFVISRPSDVGFIDPRGEAQGVMSAIAHEARIAVEFLRPATLNALRERLRDTRLPTIDIVHFDGHGVYDADGRHWEDAKLGGQMLTKKTQAEAADTGYLLFEDGEGNKALVSADELGDLLNRQKIGLMVLSACQSAMVGTGKGDNDSDEDEADAMGSVAARLTHAGIPTVLAMTYSVLVSTTQQLFEQFYKNLSRGRGMGESLDDARQHLFFNRERGERQRGQERVTLRLQDWFLPALYQAGADTPLLSAAPASNGALAGEGADAAGFGNLPKLQEAGFFGRSRELWQIERAFVQGTRRLSIVGFGGQGKTFLAQEAGRWLCQTGLFQRVCFVDYASFQGTDAVGLAVSTLGTVLDQSFVDVAAATAGLRQHATLIVLDNLEALSAESLRDLLDAAYGWSQVGDCRVLLTSRQPDFGHAEYKTEGSREHIRLVLSGLGSEAYPTDALNYFQALMKLPPAPKVPAPERAALVNLFKLVDFHPLSIGLLARQLKVRRPAELGQRLESLLAETTETDKDKSLVASLKLSLDRLGPEAQKWLLRLGVFQGGAMEDVLLGVTGLGRADENPEVTQARQLVIGVQNNDMTAVARAVGIDLPDDVEFPKEIIQKIQQYIQKNSEKLTDFQQTLSKMTQSELADGADEGTWPTLRQALVAGGLLQLEQIPCIRFPFLKFHPTLAPVLWPQLSETEQADLLARYRQRYYQLSVYLYHEDRKNPELARAIARRELPNLMMAVNGALAEGTANAVDFVTKVSSFLHYFGLRRDRRVLTDKQTQAVGTVGSPGWVLSRSNQGESLYSAGRYAESARVFVKILQELGDEPSSDQCSTLGMLGRCFEKQGQVAQAAAYYRQGLTMAAELEQSDGVKRHKGTLHADLANVLMVMGDYAGAKESYEASSAIAKEIGDVRMEVVSQGQLGTLAMAKGELREAAEQHQAALKTFQQLGEPTEEATAWHLLGNVYEEAQQWDEAERHYRESARIKDARGDLVGAAQTWTQLAVVSAGAGQVEAAIAWFEKAIKGFRSAADRPRTATVLNNFAHLLQSQQNAAGQFPHLAAARQHAEESLAIKQTLDPAAADIWTTHSVLSQIAEKQERADDARRYRQQARQAKAAFAGTPYELRRYGALIAAVVAAAAGDVEAQAQLLPQLDESAEGSKANLVSAIRRILAGERDEESLVDPLACDHSMFVIAILQGIAEPSYLETLQA